MSKQAGKKDAKEQEGSASSQAQTQLDAEAAIKKKTLRHMGGITWEDKTLLDWPDGLFQLLS